MSKTPALKNISPEFALHDSEFEGNDVDQNDQALPLEMALKRRCFEQENEIAMLRDRNNGLTERLAALRKKSVDFALVEGRNNEQNQKIQELVKQEASLKRELVQVSFKFEEQSKHLEKSLADFSKLKNRFAEIQNSQVKENTERASRVSSLENLLVQRDEMIEMLQTAADRQNVALNDMATKYANFAAQIQEKVHSIQLLEAALQEERDSKNEVLENAQAHVNEIAQLKDWLLAREAQIHSLENDVLERTNESREFSATIQKLEGELRSHAVDAEKAQAKLKHEIELRSERISHFEQELSREAGRSRSERQELETRISQIQTESFELKMASARFQAEIQQARVEGERAVLEARKALTEEMNLRVSNDREAMERKSRERDAEQAAFNAREVARVSELEVRLRADVERAENRLRSIESQLREDLAKAQSDSSAATSQLTIFREQSVALRTERTQMEKDLAKSTETIAKLREALLERKSNGQATAEQSNRERSNLEGEFQLKAIQIEKRASVAEAELQATKNELARMQRAFETSDANYAKTEQELKAMQARNRELEMTSAKFEIALEQKTAWFKKQASEFESETKRIHEVMVNAKQRVSTARTAHKAETEKSQDLEQALKKARFSLEQKTEKADEFEKELLEAKARIETLETSLSEATEKFESFQIATRKADFVSEHKFEKLTLESKELEVEVGRLFSELETSQSKLQAGEALVKMESERTHQFELKIRKQDLQIEELTKEVQRLYSGLETSGQAAAEAKQIMRIEIEKRENVIRTLEGRAELNQGGVKLAEERLSQINLHDKRLRMYASALTKEKQKIQEMGEKLVSEIQLLSSTHPLVDYVAATEFEISKLELTLKSTPMISPERSRLEEGMAKLFEQRDFLRSVLAGSKANYEKQSTDLKKMLAVASIPVPPPVSLTPAPVVTSASSAKTSVESVIGTQLPAQQAAATFAVPLVTTDAQTSMKSPEHTEDQPDVTWEKPFDQIV